MSIAQTTGKQLAMVALALFVSGCASPPEVEPFDEPSDASRQDLHSLPEPEREIAAAVYAFPDRTGEFQETQSGQAHHARAVTQGGDAVLIRALQDAGGGDWFKVLERARLDDVLTERRIIREQRKGATDSEGNPLPGPDPLLYAGVIFEGGIIGFDTNTVTGGAGARFLGIGADTEYREDLVTVYLRAVNSQTSEIWHTVVATKRIYSTRVQANVFRFVSADDILEAEAGFTRNEPRFHALRQAIEQAVMAMVMEGAERGLWSFADKEKGKAALEAYDKDKELRRVNFNTDTVSNADRNRDQMSVRTAEGERR